MLNSLPVSLLLVKKKIVLKKYGYGSIVNHCILEQSLFLKFKWSLLKLFEIGNTRDQNQQRICLNTYVIIRYGNDMAASKLYLGVIGIFPST